MLESRSWRDNQQAGRIRHAEFATSPKRSWRERLGTLIRPDLTDNANVSIAPLGGRMTALTETPTPLAFDPETLETLGALTYADDIPGVMTTVHPHFDAERGEILNLVTAFGRRTRYQVVRLQPGSQRRELVTSIPVKRPGYIHSFAATPRHPRHVVLIEWPLTVNPLRLATSGLTGTPFIDNFCWASGAESRVRAVERATGRQVHDVPDPTGFAFHHVNAWENDGAIVLDVCCYNDARIIDALRLDRMRDPNTEYPQARLTRLRISRSGQITTTRPVDSAMELPSINHAHCNMRAHQYIYGVTHLADNNPFGGLAKADTCGQRAQHWQAPNCYPGEPVFVPAPGAVAEDDGVVMSLVLDGAAGRSFLLLLDGQRFDEHARLRLPHTVPFGFHGLFTHSDRYRKDAEPSE